MIWTAERTEKAEALFAFWQGTPHRDRMAVRGLGIDCVEFAKAILTGTGIWPQFTSPYYSPRWGIGRAFNVMEAMLLEVAHVRPVGAHEDLQTGDLCIFRVGPQSNHIGIYWPRSGRPGIWHSQVQGGVQWTGYAPQSIRKHIQCFLRLTGEGFKVEPSTLNPQSFRR